MFCLFLLYAHPLSSSPTLPPPISPQAVCNCISDDFFDLLTWLGYCNSTMNPIIYPLFMRDFKRAMAKYLPCCRRAWEGRPSPISLSVRNSNSGPRPEASLKNVLTLQGDADSADSSAQINEHSSQNLGSLPAMGVASVNLFNPEHADPGLRTHHLNTPMEG